MTNEYITELTGRYPVLDVCLEDLGAAFAILEAGYRRDGVVYLCGNGGSAADAEHIVGELMKSFSFKRPIPDSFKNLLDDESVSSRLEGALRAVALTGHVSLVTAFANDVDPAMVFAQQVYGYGREGDVLWALSTSGNSVNVLHALKVAKARGMKCIGMTGKGGGAMKELCDMCICVPAEETYKVQELHLPVYHALCRMLEDEFFKR
jgi:D-sedoheptulose 7-phosphate isomerase